MVDPWQLQVVTDEWRVDSKCGCCLFGFCDAAVCVWVLDVCLHASLNQVDACVFNSLNFKFLCVCCFCLLGTYVFNIVQTMHFASELHTVGSCVVMHAEHKVHGADTIFKKQCTAPSLWPNIRIFFRHKHFPVRAINAYRGSKGTAPLILNLSTR